MGGDRARDYAARLWRLCSGVVVIVEPGTPAGFQRIRNCRDALRDETAVLAAPCPGNGECPITGNDWCHFSVRLPRSRDHMRAKRAVVPFEDERFSYVSAARDTVALTAATPRIIAEVQSGKAGMRFRLCSDEGITQTDIPRRDRTAW